MVRKPIAETFALHIPLAAMAAVLLWCVPLAAQAQTLDDAKAAFYTGQYDDAIRIFTRQARGGESAGASRGLVRVLIEVGRYRQAEEAARRFIAANAQSAELANALGEVLQLVGRLDEAEEMFQRAIARQASDSLTAKLNLATLQYQRGEREEAVENFAKFIDFYNQRVAVSAAELTAVATAARYLGNDNWELFHDALRVFDEAFAADTASWTPRVRAGELFLEKYDGQEALASFTEVLEANASHPAALLGLARSLHFNGSPEAMEMTRKSLEINSNSVSARTFLATLYLELEDYGSATVEAERALEIDPGALEALSVLAAARYMAGDHQGFSEARNRVFARNPRYADLYNTLAEISARNRLYHDAVAFGEQGVTLDHKSWRAFGLLGMNQLRIGVIEEGRANLEIAFAGDPFHVWIKNTLDLLDSFVEYHEASSERFEFIIHEKEAAVLAPYFAELAEETYERLARRYDYRPETPIRVEIYPRHADFSVRTFGLTGVGALGVSFGPVLAMDSPSARETGEFNWGSTLWHEIAHSFHLSLTEHRVPRWFSEGLAVHEEHRARPGWGDDVSVGFLVAHKRNRLLPVGQLNNGFVRPTYPQQVIFSYYQASLICELIEKEWGTQALIDLLDAFKAGQDTEEAFHSVLAMELESFDEQFIRYLEQRFAGPLASLRAADAAGDPRELSESELAERAATHQNDFAVQLAIGRLLFDQERFDEAIPYLRRAETLFPEYSAPDSPRWYLAYIYKESGDVRLAADELTALTSVNASFYRAHLELAAMRRELGEDSLAAAALDQALYVYPFDIATHEELAELYGGLGESQKAIRERRAVVALNPVDRAEALYQLARAYYRAGDLDSARSEVLQALELAPRFDEALDLLLEIRAARDRTGADGSSA